MKRACGWRPAAKKNITASDCFKMCPVCNIALSYFCCLPSKLTLSARGNETAR